MSPDDRWRVQHMVEAAEQALAIVREREFKAKRGNGRAFEVKDVLSDTRLGAGNVWLSFQ